MATALDVPEETVTQHDRNLVMAGLRTKGGRGRSAPEVTPLDAARLLVATLGSIRAKDSVETVQEFERAIFDESRTYSAGAARIRGLPLPKNPKEYGTEKFLDAALMRLPETHNLVEGLAAVIHDASQPIDDLKLFLDRFSNLGVGLNSGGNATIGGLAGFASYRIPRGERPKLSVQEWKELDYCRQGITQSRSVFGTAIMLVGAAFRDNGLRFCEAREAYLAGYGTSTKSQRGKVRRLPRRNTG